MSALAAACVWLALSASTETTMDVRIAVVESRATHRSGHEWELSIRWRFTNDGDQPLYVLLTRPLSNQLGDPLVLDHTSHGGRFESNPNATPGFHFLTVPAHQSLEEELSYSLALPNAPAQVSVAGHFGVSRSAPDSAWERDKNWKKAEQWQHIVTSPPSIVRLSGKDAAP